MSNPTALHCTADFFPSSLQDCFIRMLAPTAAAATAAAYLHATSPVIENFIIVAAAARAPTAVFVAGSS
jgi:hypothetical protein